MNKTVTLEIPQSEWKKFNEELVRTIAVMHEQQRESDERWMHIAKLKTETSDLMQELRRRLQDVEQYLGSSEIDR